MLMSGILLVEPIEDFLTVPGDDARLRQDIFQRAADIFDAMGRAADVGMHGQGHDAYIIGAFLIQAVKIIAGPFLVDFRFVILDHLLGDVVDFVIVGQGDDRPVGGLDGHRLIVEHPVADVFDTGFGQ